MRSKRSYFVILTALCILTGLCVFVCLRFGSASLRFSQVWHGLLRSDPGAPETQILWSVRLPHAAGCFLAGFALALSGLLLQTATANPLAGPNIIGVNAGAGFAMVLTMALVPMAYRFVPLICSVGAFLCTLLIVFVSTKAGGSRVTIVLAGVAISTLLGAGISLLKLIDPDLAVIYHSFSVGGVSGVLFGDLALPAAIIAVCAVAATMLSGRLNLLCLGDTIALGLGVRVKALRTVALILASALAAAAVSFAGLLGFVGLMVPHMARKLLGCTDVRRLLPVCALLGAVLVMISDLLGRTLFAPSQIPAGIVTAVLGAPFFFILLLQRRNRL